MNVKESYPILYEAYENYQRTGNRHFIFSPKNADFVYNVLNTVPYLKEHGYIDNVSENLIIDNKDILSISISPTEFLSFDITFSGIRFAEADRND